jgi:hypothetical protein
MRLLFKLLSGFLVDAIWGFGLYKALGITIGGWWAFIIPPIISLFPGGEFVNQFLILAGIYFIYDEGWQQSVQEWWGITPPEMPGS